MFNKSTCRHEIIIYQSFLEEIDPFSQQSFRELLKENFATKKFFIIAMAYEKEHFFIFNAELFIKNFYVEKNGHIMLIDNKMINPLNNRNSFIKIEFYKIDYDMNWETKSLIGRCLGSEQHFVYYKNFQEYLTVSIK